MERAISALGILVFIGISYAFSVNRRAVRWRVVAWGLGLEFALA
ncbi:MAG TPA: Na+ dependent nucleoside transporter N-terminal domain-containing protein, partial [Nostoc sp.]